MTGGRVGGLRLLEGILIVKIEQDWRSGPSARIGAWHQRLRHKPLRIVRVALKICRLNYDLTAKCEAPMCKCNAPSWTRRLRHSAYINAIDA